jgi:hypothetical protein
VAFLLEAVPILEKRSGESALIGLSLTSSVRFPKNVLQEEPELLMW